MSPTLLKTCQKIINMKVQSTVNGCCERQCGENLYPSRYEAVSSSKDELLGVVCVRRGQEDLAWPWAVSCGQNELLLGSRRRLHCCHYLDLLTRLLVSYNLSVAKRKTSGWTLTCFVWLKWKQEKVMLGMYLYPLLWCSGLSGDYLIALRRPTYHWVRRRGWHLEYKTQPNDLNLNSFSLHKTDWVNYERNSELNVLLFIFQYSICRSIGYIQYVCGHSIQ